MWHSGLETRKSYGYTRITMLFIMTHLCMTSDVAVSEVTEVGNATPATFKLIN